MEQDKRTCPGYSLPATDKTFFTMRHAHGANQEAGIFDTNPRSQIPSSAQGLAQLETLDLSAIPEGTNSVTIFTSMALRCLTTANSIAEKMRTDGFKVDIVQTTQLAEPRCEIWDGKLFSKDQVDALNDLHRFLPHDFITRSNDIVESGKSFFNRTRDVVLSAMNSTFVGQVVIFVTHYHNCQTLLNLADGCNPALVRNIENAKLYPLVFKPNPLARSLAAAPWSSLTILFRCPKEKFVADLEKVCLAIGTTINGYFFLDPYVFVEGKYVIEITRRRADRPLMELAVLANIQEQFNQLGYKTKMDTPPVGDMCCAVIGHMAGYNANNTEGSVERQVSNPYSKLPDTLFNPCFVHSVWPNGKGGVDNYQEECDYVVFPDYVEGEIHRIAAENKQERITVVYSKGVSVTHEYK
jgi:broad specificity phosphatase PhoE